MRKSGSNKAEAKKRAVKGRRTDAAQREGARTYHPYQRTPFHPLDSKKNRKV